MSRSFVLSELRRFLDIGLCRIEMQPRRSKWMDYSWLKSGSLGRVLEPEGTRESRGGWALLSLDEAFDSILF
jgi:hypothetical protein